MNPLHNPHDAFFKETLSNQENAKSFLANYLPKELLELVDIDSLEVQKDSFITKELQEYFSDLLYKVRFQGQDGYIYLLFEHKSYPEGGICLQLLEYMLQCWKLKREQKEALPIIVPLVVYHGQKNWTAPLRLSGLVACRDARLLKYFPDFEYILHDLTCYDDVQIMGTGVLKVMLQLLRYSRSPDLLQKLGEILRWLDREADLAYLSTITIYVLSVTKIPQKTFLQIAQENLSQEGGKRVMNTLQTMLEESRLEGKLEGELKGKLETARNMLLKGMDIGLIAELTGLATAQVKELAQDNGK